VVTPDPLIDGRATLPVLARLGAADFGPAAPFPAAFGAVAFFGAADFPFPNPDSSASFFVFFGFGAATTGAGGAVELGDFRDPDVDGLGVHDDTTDSITKSSVFISSTFESINVIPLG